MFFFVVMFAADLSKITTKIPTNQFAHRVERLFLRSVDIVERVFVFAFFVCKKITLCGNYL